MIIHIGNMMLPLPSLGAIFAFGLPFLIGLVWVWRDANRRGQPGWLWVLLTIPLNWIALLAYVIVRALLVERSAMAVAPATPPPTTSGNDAAAS